MRAHRERSSVEKAESTGVTRVQDWQSLERVKGPEKMEGVMCPDRRGSQVGLMDQRGVGYL